MNPPFNIAKLNDGENADNGHEDHRLCRRSAEVHAEKTATAETHRAAPVEIAAMLERGEPNPEYPLTPAFRPDGLLYAYQASESAVMFLLLRRRRSPARLRDGLPLAWRVS